MKLYYINLKKGFYTPLYDCAFYNGDQLFTSRYFAKKEAEKLGLIDYQIKTFIQLNLNGGL